MSKLVSDSVTVIQFYILVTELSRSPLHVSGTVCQILLVGRHGCRPVAVGSSGMCLTVDWSICTLRERVRWIPLIPSGFHVVGGQPSDDELTLASCTSMGWREDVEGRPKVVVELNSAGVSVRRRLSLQ